MRIEHIAMYVHDLEGARNFLSSTLTLNPMKAIIIRKQIFDPISCHLMTVQDWKS